MRTSPGLAALALFLVPLLAPAEVAPVVVKLPDDPKAWTGQRLLFRVELRSRGSFGGATSFTLPEVPGTVIMKTGNATVSSEQLEGESWFIQSHFFALFSQEEGPVEIPEFPVRFGTREGFTGPVTDVEALVPGFQVTIERPPGTERSGFLITAESLQVEEEWDPVPGTETVETGAVFRRTITQRAENMTGMALAPVPDHAPEGIRAYPGQAEVRDETERGDFRGERIETITYLVEKPGTHTFPEIRYSWWNPAAKSLESKTLPAVTIRAKAAPSPVSAERRRHFSLIATALLASIVALTITQRRHLAAVIKRLEGRLHSPEREASRHLLRACRENDPRAALAAWFDWCNARPDSNSIPVELGSEIAQLENVLYRADPNPASWNGDDLAARFRQFRSQRSARSSRRSQSPLAPLNP